ncbi:hypothetical protein ABIB40_000648 [Pedobacter sp. UYP30]|uniref:hypothetical protein n=1 Tax=Pedobacter sp. UYP30 TaxID=1756400 RepID=UPI0033942005
MKRGILILFFFCTYSAFAQQKDVDKAVQKFIVQFNQAKYDYIYQTLSAKYKLTVSKNTLEMYMVNIHRMTSGIKSAKFVSAHGQTFNYYFICEDEATNADFQCALNADGKFDYLSFKRVGGTGNPPTVGKIKN